MELLDKIWAFPEKNCILLVDWGKIFATILARNLISLAHQTVQNLSSSHWTVRDTARRKRNVIISSLPEPTNIDDRTSFLNIYSEHLSVKPHLSTDSCIRIGIANLNQPW